MIGLAIPIFDEVPNAISLQRTYDPWVKRAKFLISPKYHSLNPVYSLIGLGKHDRINQNASSHNATHLNGKLLT